MIKLKMECVDYSDDFKDYLESLPTQDLFTDDHMDMIKLRQIWYFCLLKRQPDNGSQYDYLRLMVGRDQRVLLYSGGIKLSLPPTPRIRGLVQSANGGLGHFLDYAKNAFPEFADVDHVPFDQEPAPGWQDAFDHICVLGFYDEEAWITKRSEIANSGVPVKTFFMGSSSNLVASTKVNVGSFTDLPDDQDLQREVVSIPEPISRVPSSPIPVEHYPELKYEDKDLLVREIDNLRERLRMVTMELEVFKEERAQILQDFDGITGDFFRRVRDSVGFLPFYIRACRSYDMISIFVEKHRTILMADARWMQMEPTDFADYFTTLWNNMVMAEAAESKKYDTNAEGSIVSKIKDPATFASDLVKTTFATMGATPGFMTKLEGMFDRIRLDDITEASGSTDENTLSGEVDQTRVEQARLLLEKKKRADEPQAQKKSKLTDQQRAALRVALIRGDPVDASLLDD